MMGGVVIACGMGLLLLVAVMAAGGYVGVRLVRARPESGVDSARALLERRLAAGEIDVDEYYEREGALPPRDARRGL